MEVWREPDDVRIAVAQERLMRERPSRLSQPALDSQELMPACTGMAAVHSATAPFGPGRVPRPTGSCSVRAPLASFLRVRPCSPSAPFDAFSALAAPAWSCTAPGFVECRQGPV
jgi:hypothetical protein